MQKESADKDTKTADTPSKRIFSTNSKFVISASFSIVAIAVSFLSVWSSIEANQKSEEAIQEAREANRLAEEANQFSERARRETFERNAYAVSLNSMYRLQEKEDGTPVLKVEATIHNSGNLPLTRPKLSIPTLNFIEDKAVAITEDGTRGRLPDLDDEGWLIIPQVPPQTSIVIEIFYLGDRSSVPADYVLEFWLQLDEETKWHLRPGNTPTRMDA